MAAHGYFPTSQSWAPGQWGAGAFFVALLLCFLLIGFLALIYMLIVRPEGTLTVTYERRTVIEGKTCPKCAERIKAAALVCHFCGYKFTPDELQKQKALEPPVVAHYQGYEYVHSSDGTAELKLSSGGSRKFSTVDYLKEYVDAITGHRADNR
jgi:Uncharacterised protein family UPF0547